MKTIKVIIFLSLLPLSYLLAQVSDPKLIPESLELMKGKWTGSGWIQAGPGPRQIFNHNEHVYSKLDGQLLILNGEARDTETAKVTFQAFGVVKAKSDTTFQVSTYTLEGRHTIADAKIENRKFIWWFEAGNGATIRYEIALTDDTWTEEGYYIPSPDQRFHMFHMELKRL